VAEVIIYGSVIRSYTDNVVDIGSSGQRMKTGWFYKMNLNQGSNPGGPNYVGDIACVNGSVRVCTYAGSPGTWTVVGSQT
jgi:hypothetical protein